MRLIGTYNLRFPVVVENATLWSEDDKLAILTSKCIYIYDLLANPGNVTTKMNWKLKFIHNSEEVNPWQLDMDLNREKLFMESIESDIGAINMDKTLSPQMESGKASFRQFIKGDWICPLSISPKLISSNVRSDESYLLTLTSDHWVRLYGLSKTDCEWVLMKDISETLHSHLKSSNWETSQPHNVDTLRTRSYAQATVSFLWINKYQIFLLAQKNGDIFVLDKDLKVQSVFKGLNSLEMNLLFAVPRSQDFVLLACGIDGRIHGFKVNPESLEFVALRMKIWNDPDMITIAQILLILNETNRMRLLVTKGCFIVYINIVGEEVEVEDAVAVSSSPINSIIRTGEDAFIIMPLSRSLIVMNNDKAMNEFKELNSHLDMVHYTNKGLIQSRHGAMTVLVQNVSAYHDHLVLRTPVKLTFFTYFESPLKAIESKLNVPDFSVKEYRDHIEVGRILFLKMEDSKFIEKEEIKNLQLRFWYLEFFKYNQRKTISEEEHKEMMTNILKDYAGTSKELKKLMDKEGNFKATDEKCIICESNFILNEVDRLVCSNDHVFPRCVISLKLVDTPQLLQCRWCKSIANPEYNTHLNIPCPLCGGPFDN